MKLAVSTKSAISCVFVWFLAQCPAHSLAQHSTAQAMMLHIAGSQEKERQTKCQI